MSTEPIKQVPLFHCTSPCADCPYRQDSPKQLWDQKEFKRLLETEDDLIGVTYGCHKKNGSVCVGWLMNQEQRGMPSIALRFALLTTDVPQGYLENLHSPAPLYTTVEEMIAANYPRLIRKKTALQRKGRRILRHVSAHLQNRLSEIENTGQVNSMYLEIKDLLVAQNIIHRLLYQ